MIKPVLEPGTQKPLASEEKQRARDQWGEDPCGAVHGREHEFGTREFFETVEQHRYHDYAPWMPDVMGFNQFAGGRLLEIGCGMGTDLLQFARGGAICTGADLTPRSIEITRHRFAVYDERGSFLITDGECLPFAEESFDVVYSNGVLHHTPDTARAVSEIHRVLKPDGVAKVMLYYKHSVNYWIELMLRRGVMGGELFRGRSSQEIMSRWVEYSEHGGCPLVKVYSRGEARKLFGDFKDVQFQVRQLTRSDLRFIGRIVPQAFMKLLERHVGWNLIITARK